MRGLAEGRNIIIRPADKGSSVVLQHWEYCLAEAEKQLQEVDIFEDTDFKESDLVKLVKECNTMHQSPRRKNVVTKKELKYIIHQYKKSTNFGKMYLLPNIHERKLLNFQTIICNFL